MNFNPLRAISRFFRGIRHELARRRHLADVRRFLRHIKALAARDARSAPRKQADGIRLSLIAPTYNTPPAYLDALVRSFLEQGCPDAELILSDDASPDPATRAALAALDHPAIRIVWNERNGGIAAASNAGLAAACGEWVSFIDHDDALFPHALDRMLRALDANPQCQFLFTDEIITDGNLKPEDLFLKPNFDEVLLSGVNFINHFSCYRRERLATLGNFRLGFDGSQDYDLVLRYTRGLKRGETLHLPYPAYCWRRDGRSYSMTFLEKATNHARKAIAERFSKPDMPLEIGPALLPDLHRVRFDRAMPSWPRVSIIIPSRNAPDLIRQVLIGLFETTTYPDFEVIIADNGTKNPQTLEIYAEYSAKQPNFRVEIKEEPFNFSASVNRGVRLANGTVLLLLNNDIEILDPDWLTEMVSCCAFEDVGIVGARLLYPNHKLQHAGVIVGFGGYAGHWFLGEPADFSGPMGRMAVRQSLSAVTGACLLITRPCWDALGPFDETRFAIAYNDIDYCLRARKAGFRVIYTPFARLMHHESASRGSDETPQNITRFKREQAALDEAHGTNGFRDPAINPWYTRDRSHPVMKLLDDLPQAR